MQPFTIGPGLVHIGNLGFVAAITQLLFHAPGFREMIAEAASSGARGSEDGRLVQALADVLGEMAKRGPLDAPVSMQPLVDAFGWGAAEIVEQHDLLEFYVIFVDKLRSESPIIDAYFTANCTGTTSVNVMPADGSLPKGASLRQILEQTPYSVSQQPALLIDVAAKDAPTLDAAIRNFCTAELLTGSNQYMRSDRQRVNAYFCHAMGPQFPPLLSFAVKRFEFDFNTMRNAKVTSAMTFPMRLDLSEFASGAAAAASVRDPPVYHLIGVASHLGTVGGGVFSITLREPVTTPGGDGGAATDGEEGKVLPRFSRWSRYSGEDVQTYSAGEEGDAAVVADNEGGATRSNTAILLCYIRESAATSFARTMKEGDN